MTAGRLRLIRKTLGITQREMAERLGLSLRAYNHAEAGYVRKSHVLAAETMAVKVAVERRDASLLVSDLQDDCLKLDGLIRGTEWAGPGCISGGRPC